MNEQSYEDFISTVSHELRTPLTSIRGFSQTMLASWDKLDDENKKKFLKIIEEQSNRLISLVENMLSVTKIQSAKENLIYKETDIKPVINTVVSLVKNQYPTRNYTVEITSNIPTILVDRDKFQQVMMNLIENAAKYSFDNTTVKITAGFCENSDFVSIKVSDTGVKIEEADFEKIFTKFSRIDNPLTRRVQGSGLGLYITKTIIDKMSGKISVSSNAIDSEKAETTFEVKFPAYSVETQAREKCKQ
ncbi:HAMP domain-containing histidine kinase [bacterium]|nr:HAMP domain-containing histidine kinase [bacterium]